MNIRAIIPEIILIALMAVSGIIIVTRLWQDAIIAVGVLVLILCLGGLILLLIVKIGRMEEAAVHQERAMRANLESLGRQLIAKQDATAQQIVASLENNTQNKPRMYR
ncbi:MAG TPA: hypothetical protein O0X25_02155 [Methanocorpusculum sp.]|nr:hypothetical protein [Methanocorpusculum sp.]HJJ39794.1 hypothetical protein [Methanocorpusculum sp.]HJJ49404.1 hypothetical protein [Methanocorpusculum sp.]HJJ57522.1 hypothetical protein [Methanocorpusculum sp.]